MDPQRRVRRRAGAEIGDDALREVLARVRSPRDLLRCAVTCKRWRRLIADRDLLRRAGLWPDTARRPCVLAGIFIQYVYPVGASRSTKETHYVPPQFLSLEAGLGRKNITLDSLVTHDHGDQGLFDLARALTARRGFLLVRILLPCAPGHNNNRPKKLHLAVCRPLVDGRSLHLLPPPPFDMTGSLDDSIIGCVILTADDLGEDLVDHKQQPPMFQVLLIYKDDNNRFLRACTYSSSKPDGWSAPVKCCRSSGLIRCGPRSGVVAHGGIVHWVFMDDHDKTHPMYTLSVTPVTHSSTLTKTPMKIRSAPPIPRSGMRKENPPSPIPCIGGEGGTLSFVTVRTHAGINMADLWTKHGGQDQDDWRCSELAKLGIQEVDLVFFAESRGALLVQHGDSFSIVDLKSKEETPVDLQEGKCWCYTSCSSTCCFGHNSRTGTCIGVPSVLYEMDIQGLI